MRRWQTQNLFELHLLGAGGSRGVLVASTPDLQKTVGANLRAYRLERGLSQEAFAEVLGVHRTYMGGVERGERNLTLKRVEKIAEQISMDARELMVAPD